MSSIWRWRNQYGEVLGGTGIGEGDRGVICGREAACLGAKEVEQETDCDAADAREQLSHHHSSPASTPSPSSSFTTGSPLSSSAAGSETGSYRTPSPNAHPPSSSSLFPSSSSVGLVVVSGPGVAGVYGLRPGYARHEIEGIGGVVKTKLVRMLRVGACVPEWEDEKNKGQILEREVSGGRRSWCGWCCRVIPGAKDLILEKS